MIVHIFLTPFRHESRALKEMRATIAADLTDAVTLVGLWEDGLPEDESVAPRLSVHRVRVGSRALPRTLAFQLVKYFEWMVRVLAWGTGKRVELIHAHSLAALPASVFAKYLWRAKLVYDAHELEPEKNGLSRVRRRLACIVERLFIRCADAVLVVTPSIADWYAETYGIVRPVVMLNIPAGDPVVAETSDAFRLAFKIPDDHVVFVYQGSLGYGRGVERLLEAFAQVPPERHLVVMGYGALQATVEQAAERHANVHFHPAVHPERVLEYTGSADIGICLIQNTCLSYYYSLPNKLFEYLRSGLPVLVSDFPEMGRVVDRWNCGWREPARPAGLVAFLSELAREDIEARRAGAWEAARHLNWDEEVERMLATYRRLLRPGAPA